MITKDQIHNLSKTFQIDSYSIFREYLQLVFLSYFYQEKGSSKYYFKGGTALRLLYGSPRFSEDLDFSTNRSNADIEKFLSKIEKKLELELPGLRIKKLHEGREGLRFQVKYTDQNFKYPLNIRLDFHQQKLIKGKTFSTLRTKFPVMIFPQVFHISMEGILKEKLKALEERNKGRDLFDIWYLLSKGVEHDKVNAKALENLKNFPSKSLEIDLSKFLPKGQKKIIPVLKEEIVKMI
jgi:predicted nucleotidyltransferase component of viral defense system